LRKSTAGKKRPDERPRDVRWPQWNRKTFMCKGCDGGARLSAKPVVKTTGEPSGDRERGGGRCQTRETFQVHKKQIGKGTATRG